MAEIRPFKGLRFTKAAGKIEELVCPPYDIISEEERRAYLEQNGNNVIRLELPKEGRDPYKEAGNTLKEWLDNGILAQDEKDSIYIYEEEFSAYGQSFKVKGLIARVKLEPFSKGIVLPHEFTLSKAKADRFNLMQATACNFSQIYSLYMDDSSKTASKLNALSNKEPEIAFKDEIGVIHRLWTVTDESAINEIASHFENRKLYIADGHHRYETALNYQKQLEIDGKSTKDSNYVMMMLVDMENQGLIVFPTHRIVRGLEQFNKEEVLSKCAPFFEITYKTGLAEIESELKSLHDAGEKAFGFYFGDKDGYAILTLKDLCVMSDRLPSLCEASRGLDVSILHTLVLEGILGIDKENMANQINLTYTKHVGEAVDSVLNGKADCAFILNPTRVSEIREVASAGEKMPQKSTYFYPKLITGLVMNKII